MHVFIGITDKLAGDVSPMEDLSLYLHGGRCIYTSFDYGSTQLLELTQVELHDLKWALKNFGLDPAYVVPAPEPLPC